MKMSSCATCASRQHSLKAEDFTAATIVDGKARAVFGVFDSHGGKEAGEICSTEMANSFLGMAPDGSRGHDAFPHDLICDIFWEMDHRLGREQIFSGTTASILCVAQSAEAPEGEGGPTLCCTLAWVGDSTAISVDMRASDAMPQPLRTTVDHKPTHEGERQRCIVEWEVRRELAMLRESQREEEIGLNTVQLKVDDPLSSDWSESFILLKDSGASFYAKKRAPSITETRVAVEAAGLEVSEADMLLLQRALRREKRIEAPERKMSFVLGRETTRQNTSVITRVVAGGYHGPMVLAGGSDGKVSTCVTRSVGDWDGARAMIPHPDLLRWEVGPEQHERVIICSDGVWDLLSAAEAAAIGRRAPTAEAAARTIADRARARSMRKFDRLKDDTTCMVVDLNPSQLAVAREIGSGGGCCAVS